MVCIPAYITLVAGCSSSVEVSFYIQPNSNDGDNKCNFDTDLELLTFTINTPSGVTANPHSLTYNECKDGGDFNYQTVEFSASSSAISGNISFTQTYNNSGGSFNYDNAVFNVYVTTPITDTTPPVITPRVVGTSGLNGWYVSDVTVSWIVEEPESSVTPLDPCEPTITIDYDTDGVTLTCTATSAGGTSSQSVKIMRDATGRSGSASAALEPNGNGWNNSAVTVSFSGTDATTNIAFCDDDVVLKSEAAGQSASGTCTDYAGTVNDPATASDINLDKTAPIVNLVGGPVDSGIYYFGFVPPAPSCSASDVLSGLDGA